MIVELKTRIEHIGPEVASLIVEAQKFLYPPKMQILDNSIWEEELASTPYSVGLFDEKDYMIGWRIFRRDIGNKMIYASDLSVLPSYRGQGFGYKIVRASLKDPRWNQETIHSFLRETSYHIVANPVLTFECGYEIVFDRLIKSHYMTRFGIDEDAHEVLMNPIKKY